MISHIHTKFEFISIPYENQHQTPNIKKIDRGQIKFREYSITLLQPYTLTSDIKKIKKVYPSNRGHVNMNFVKFVKNTANCLLSSSQQYLHICRL